MTYDDAVKIVNKEYPGLTIVMASEYDTGWLFSMGVGHHKLLMANMVFVDRKTGKLRPHHFAAPQPGIFIEKKVDKIS